VGGFGFTWRKTLGPLFFILLLSSFTFINGCGWYYYIYLKRKKVKALQIFKNYKKKKRFKTNSIKKSNKLGKYFTKFYF